MLEYVDLPQLLKPIMFNEHGCFIFIPYAKVNFPSQFQFFKDVLGYSVVSFDILSGFEIWRIENFWPKSFYGKFHGDDSYIILKVSCHL